MIGFIQTLSYYKPWLVSGWGLSFIGSNAWMVILGVIAPGL